MGKIMAIDYGLRRIGIAETDELQLIATGLTTVDNNLIWKFLETHLSKNVVDCIVVGKPVGLDGLATDSTLQFKLMSSMKCSPASSLSKL
jgi:putative holliday junction resolvase